MNRGGGDSSAGNGGTGGEAATVRLHRLGAYTLTGQVGEGGMGVVHRALDAAGNVVAVKVLRPHVAGDSDGRARFAREARALERVRGPHVAEVLDADVDSAAPYLVTRFVSGPSLYQVVDRSGPLSGAHLHKLAHGLADALCSVHEAGVVHRDLKPGNVLMQRGEPVVIDFGIAQLGDETRLTVPGMVFGTPGYLAPELLAGGAVTPAADVYAWAATLVYAATGRPPYDRKRFEAIAYAVLHEEPDLSGVPDGLAPLLAWCLAKEPRTRPVAHELRDRLARGDLPRDVPAATSVLPLTAPEAPAERDRDRYDEWTGGDADDAGDDAGADAGAEVDDGLDEERYDERYEEPIPPSFDGRRHRVVMVLLFALVGALGAVVPLAAAAVLVGWPLLARTVDRSGLFVERRRATRGRRRSDGFAAAGALPWHGLVAALLTLLTLPVALLGAGLLAGVGVLAARAGGLPPDLRLVGGITALAVALLCWAGLDGRSVRRGSRRVLARVLGTRGFAVAVGVLLAVAVGVLGVRAGAAPDQLWPVIDGSQVGQWLLDGVLDLGVRL